MARSDLDGRLPIVYNGRSVEEWYRLYCEELARNQRLTDALTEVIAVYREPVGNLHRRMDFTEVVGRLVELVESR